MRSAILFCLFVLFGCITKAQFTILPQAGLENTNTSVEVDRHPAFFPIGTKLSPQAAIRLDYKFKHVYGLYVGIATSRSIVKYNFSDPETVPNNDAASKGNIQLRLEGGLQLNSKPIYFKKAASAAKSSTHHYQKNTEGRSYGNYIMRYSWGSGINKAVAQTKDRGAWFRIQPSVGVAYIPSAPNSEIYTKSGAAQTIYQYNAGNWNTALISGLGFEFGKNEQPKFLVSVNYVRGIGNLDTKSVTAVSGSKSTITSLQSAASGWNVRMGIPISLGKKKPALTKQQLIDKTYYERKKCGQYRGMCRWRCGRVI